MEKPVKNIPVRDTLFGDLPLDYWAGINSNELPWTLFKKAKDFDDDGEDREAIEALQEVLAIPALESRQYLQAYHFLNQMYSVKDHDSKLLGVVVEVAMEQGTDLLAVYADHSARYYNYSGGAIVWETRTAVMDDKIDNIFTLGKEIVKQIGPWKYERPDSPKKGMARINLLTSGGLHFGEGSQAVLFDDPMAGKLMYAMLNIMETLIELSMSKS